MTPAAAARPEAGAAEAAESLEAVRAAVRAAVHGKDAVIELALTALLAGGHLLLEDVPGVGKTTLAQALARALGGRFARIQLTSDLLPGDITGSHVLDPRTGEVAFRPGPLFANVVLADELNRTTPKTQSALFEAMAEGQVTADGQSLPLPRPFLVVATQNPWDHHGTWALPESQLDRFLMRLSVGYPGREAERRALREDGPVAVGPAVDPERMQALIAAAQQVRVAAPLEDHLLDLVQATREDPRFVRGASVRGSQALHRATRARAFLEGRDYAVPEDLRALVVPVLAHRVLARQRDGEAAALTALLAELRAP